MPQKLNRRHVLASGAAIALARPAIAQSKPERLVFVGDPGAWKKILNTEQAPAFEKETGIRIEITQLPIDALNARLRSEFASGGTEIDIVQWTNGWTGWIHRYLEDHRKLLATASKITPDWDWGDFITPALQMGQFDGVQLGVPYRATVNVLHYQKALLEQAGVKPPGTWPEFLKAALAVNTPPQRYAFGIFGLQGAGMFVGWNSWHYSNGGRLLDFNTGEVFVNDDKGVEALTFYAELNTKYKVVPPEAMTWAFDEIVAGGQSDRYAMVQMFAPYGTLINDPKLSKTGGKWAWTTVPGPTSPDQGVTWIDGHNLGVPKYTKNKEWALEFIRMACGTQWQKRAMIRGNAPPLRSVLYDPAMIEQIGWPPVAAKALETGIPTPANPVWDTLEMQLRSALSQALFGQKTPKQALDDLAADWHRSLHRAGIGRG